jgi:hypothetical protein
MRERNSGGGWLFFCASVMSGVVAGCLLSASLWGTLDGRAIETAPKNELSIEDTRGLAKTKDDPPRVDHQLAQVPLITLHVMEPPFPVSTNLTVDMLEEETESLGNSLDVNLQFLFKDNGFAAACSRCG